MIFTKLLFFNEIKWVIWLLTGFNNSLAKNAPLYRKNKLFLHFKIYPMKKIVLAFISILFIASSCSTIKVTAEYDGSVKFNEFKTYSYLGWSQNSDQLINDFDKRRLEAAFAHEFEIRNIKYVQSGGDIEVSLFLVTEQKTATTAYTEHYGGYGGYYYGHPWGWGGGFATTTYHQYDYNVGTLVCDVFDASEKRLVWQGVGSGTVDDNPSSRDKNIKQAVQKIMGQYPIPPSK